MNGGTPGAGSGHDAQVKAFIDHGIHQRYFESLNKVTPVDVYFGREKAVLKQRVGAERKTLKMRRIMKPTR